MTGAFVGAATATSTTINATTGLTTGTVTNLGATVTITDAGAVDLSTTALQAGVTTFNASTNTGGVTGALGTLVSQTVTGSAGNDTITSGAVLSTGSVNAGGGTADVLVIGANVAHVNTTALAAKYTNFETLRMSGTLDMALVAGITAVELTNAATLTNMSAAQAAAVQIRTNNADGTGDAQSFSLASSAGTSDVLTITAGIAAWDKYPATVLLFKPTQAAIDFCKQLSGMIITLLSNHPHPLFVDQVALFRLIEGGLTPAKLVYLKHILTDTDSPNAYFRILHGSWTK